MKISHSHLLAGAVGVMLSVLSCSEQEPPSAARSKSIPTPEASQQGLQSVPKPPAAEGSPADPAGKEGSEPSLIVPPGLPVGGTNPTTGIAPPPVDPSQAGRPAVLPEPTLATPTAPDSPIVPMQGAPTVADVKAMLGDQADQWEITEIRHGVAGPGEGPKGPDGKVVEIPQELLKQQNGDAAPKPTPTPPVAPPLSADQAPHLHR